ncbi:recombinase family protein [Colidextribacter sp. OB.20]|uniref:recombinase family protein n=1 Tax=Colidextribacter sp. OB.20 TaxID=2304568 RepID=UPI00136EE4B5|nr:recombinase family protein [Colidextribacter sp. OB.20]NBI08611.1 recombinase family protein [Colidextribacter sp. OB.20]
MPLYKQELSGLDAGLYLRKSRMEEGLDTDEVLAKHQKTLLNYAKENGIHIIETYPEVVSGESLYARPQMLRLLQDIEEGRYDCVLCMDLDRLSRGRMKDQGIILDAFKDSETLIVTPEKVYNLSDEIDEEYAELKTFMSRREYKIINKRLRRGLQQTIEDGYYVANAPYGYKKVNIDRKPTLEICESEAKFVRMMFQLYAQGYGCVSIARHINALGAHPHRAAEFNRSTISRILHSPVYVGKIVWNQKKHIKKGVKGNDKNVVIYQPKEKWTIVDGRHPPIVDQELFDQVQAILDKRYIPSKNDGTVKSPLVGLVKCANCGMNMQRLVMKGEPYLLCNKPGCCASTKFSLVEDRVLEYLTRTLAELTLFPADTLASHDTSVLETTLDTVQKELASTQRQKSRLYELLELGEYDIPTFRERMEVVRNKETVLERKATDTLRAIQDAKAADPAALAEKIRYVLENYATSDAAQRNALLHSVIQVIFYHKEKKTKPTAFYLDFILSPN